MTGHRSLDYASHRSPCVFEAQGNKHRSPYFQFRLPTFNFFSFAFNFVSLLFRFHLMLSFCLIQYRFPFLTKKNACFQQYRAPISSHSPLLVPEVSCNV